MNANASSSVGAALPWAVALFLVASAASAQSEYRSIDISVASDPRPVAKAIDTLVREFPFVVTYEDPRLEFGGDIRDYTSERRHPNAQNADSIPKRLGPARRSFVTTYDGNARSGEPLDWMVAVRSILSADEASGSSARFAVIQSEEVIHVVPNLMRNENGAWVAQASVLSARISIPPRNVNALEAINGIAAAAGQAAGAKITVGTVPIAALTDTMVDLYANNEVARDVLLRVLRSVDTRLTWRLLYDINWQMYGLNLALAGRDSIRRSLPPSEARTPVVPRERSGPTPVSPSPAPR
jgi:hypothetical protein